MGFRTLVPALVVLCAAQATAAQTSAWRFRWQAEQVLTYRVEQQTQAVEVLNGTRAETRTKTNFLKRWHVLSVDAAGVAIGGVTSVLAASFATKDLPARHGVGSIATRVRALAAGKSADASPPQSRERRARITCSSRARMASAFSPSACSFAAATWAAWSPI